MTAQRLALVSALLLAIAACSGESPKTTEDEPSSSHASSHEADRVPARFLTVADMQSAPASEDGEVPRDEDGRPFVHALLGKTVPEFTIPMHDGGELSRNDLADKWSVVDFWGLWCSDCLNDAPYASALRTALDADPDTQFISIHTPSNPKRIDRAFGKWGSLDTYFADIGTSYPVAIDPDASIAQIFQVKWTPTYLLVAPDLTIYAFRTDLNLDQTDGIKPIIRQISELKAAYTPVSN